MVRNILWLILSATAGALAGAAAAFTVTPVNVAPAIQVRTETPSAPTSTVQTPSLVKLEPRLARQFVPPGFLSRRASPVVSLYRKPKGIGLEERALTDERLLGQAVALTSDGWFVTSGSVFLGLRLADVTLWREGASYSVEKAVLDRLSGAVFFKIGIKELTVPAFGDAADLALGLEAWTERRPSEYAPTLVTSLSAKMPAVDPVSSEVASRRIALDGIARHGDAGSPVWSSAGFLVGLVESAPGEPVRILPSTAIASSFSSLMSEGAIRHAYLGVRSVDLASWRIEGERGALPQKGALLKDDRKQGKPAVAKESPAAQAGLLLGDVIVAIERDILDGTQDLGEVLSEYRSGASVKIQLRRGGQEQELAIPLGSVVTGEPLK